MIGLLDEAVALDFDVAAALVVDDRNQDLENKRFTAPTSAGAVSMLGGMTGADNSIFEPRAGVAYNENTLAV